MLSDKADNTVPTAVCVCITGIFYIAPTLCLSHSFICGVSVKSIAGNKINQKFSIQIDSTMT